MKNLYSYYETVDTFFNFPILNFNLSNSQIYMDGMFENCQKLKFINLSNNINQISILNKLNFIRYLLF